MKILRGLLFVLCVSLFAHFSHKLISYFVPGKIIGVVIVGIVLGLLINNFFNRNHWLAPLRPGIGFSFDKLLKLAVILLGLRISFQQIISIGGYGLLLVFFTITLSLILAHVLGRLTHTPPKLAALIGIGVAVCGNTAISATGPAIKANDQEISFAIAVNTLFGTLAVLFYPFIGHYLGLDDATFGLWTGIAVNDTSQVLATGFSYSDQAGEIATTIKLARNSLIGLVMVIVTMLYGPKNQGQRTGFLSKIKIPPFVIGFLIVATLNSLGLFQWMELQWGEFLWAIKHVTSFLILMALTAVGLNTKFDSLRSIGWAPLLIGITISTIVSVTSFFLIEYFDITQYIA